eukprot:COSAG01_NODE_1007_length_12161_cov_12.669624_10_plen_92_part_00
MSTEVPPLVLDRLHTAHPHHHRRMPLHSGRCSRARKAAGEPPVDHVHLPGVSRWSVTASLPAVRPPSWVARHATPLLLNGWLAHRSFSAAS